MNIADSWGMHGGDIGAGWWIVMMGVMLLFWAAVIFGIVWIIRGAGRWPGWRSESPTEARRAETPTEILERRFAEGAISVEEYRIRREALVTGGDANGARKDELLTAPPAGEGRQ